MVYLSINNVQNQVIAEHAVFVSMLVTTKEKKKNEINSYKPQSKWNKMGMEK